ncbi:endo-1,4-beta-xylanase [Kiritimatiellota bacterium B12222]|nr:endo-1,4-beta-xylanase [Kiritimatiellota bacterium B12222]
MRFFALFLVCMPLASFALPGIEILSNGTFQGTGTEQMPLAWEKGGEGEVIWDRDAAEASISLRATDEKQFTVLRQSASLPDEAVAAVLLVADVRLEDVQRGENNWHSGRIMLSYLDAEGREIRNAYSLDRLEGDADWQEMRRQFPVEAGATAIRLELQLFYPASGEISFRNVHLRALTVDEAEAWRVEADARIEKYRMADLQVKVVDEAGLPLPNAEVALRMKRHAYPFGTAVKVEMLLSDSDPQNLIYQDVITNFFNSATFEGALKDRVIARNGIEPAVAALEWLNARGISVRGHVLIWSSWRMTPSEYKENEDNPEELNELIYEHFKQTLEATAGMTLDWDVVNEPTYHHDVIDVFGREKVVEWFKWADEFEPNAYLFLNENNILLNSGNRQRAYDWAKYLLDNGAPIDGLGIQGHMWHRTMPSGQTVLQDLDFLAPLGLRLQLTEYSANSRFTEADEARYLDELLHAWFSHPATVGFTTWGFKDDLIWTDNAFLFRKDWSLKPAGLAWLKRVYGDWWTDADGKTDANGEVSMRGFKGDYELEIRVGGRKMRRAVGLGDEGLSVEVSLKDFTELDDPATRLETLNPWTLGKLPAVVDRDDEGGVEEVSVAVDAGEGALALVPPMDAEINGAYALAMDNEPSRALYMRFDLSEISREQVLDTVNLRFSLANADANPGRIQIYALSHRFVSGQGELGLDWQPALLNAENAPGRSASDGGFDLGDARVLYVGDVELGDAKPGVAQSFTSRELRRVAGESAGSGLTLMLVAPDAATLSIAGPGGEEDLLLPTLTLHLQKDETP